MLRLVLGLIDGKIPVVIPAPLFGVVGYPGFDFMRDVGNEWAVVCYHICAGLWGLVRHVVPGWIVFLKMNDDSFFAAEAIAVLVFCPGAECDDA